MSIQLFVFLYYLRLRNINIEYTIFYTILVSLLSSPQLQQLLPSQGRRTETQFVQRPGCPQRLQCILQDSHSKPRDLSPYLGFGLYQVVLPDGLHPSLVAKIQCRLLRFQHLRKNQFIVHCMLQN